MTREQFDSLYEGKAVWCKTEELAKEFLALADSVGYKWRSECSLLNETYWCSNEVETVYYVDSAISFGFKLKANGYGYTVVEFTGQPQKPQLPRVFDANSLAFELRLIDNHLSPLDPLITGLIDVVKVEDLPKVKELREHYEKMSEIIESLKGE